MEQFMKNWFESVRLGERQVHGNMRIFPLLNGRDGKPEYLALSEAIENGKLTFTEVVGKDGSVPDLKVTNNGNKPVLLLDGEEESTDVSF